MTKTATYVRRITLSAVLLAISLALQLTFSFYIPLFGENGMRVNISGIFSMLPSFLFGPVYGAIVSGLSDLLGYLLRPSGAYLPLMTLVIAAGGFLRGALWLLLAKRSRRVLRIAVAVVAVLLLAFGVLNALFLNADGVNRQFYDTVDTTSVNTEDMHPISQMLIARTIGAKDPAGSLATYLTIMTWGLGGSGVLGFLLLLVELLISKRFGNGPMARIMPLLLSMALSGMLVSTLNTLLLRETVYASWKLLPFAVVWLPRIIEEVLSNTVKAYFVALLLGVFQSQRGLRKLVQ